MASEESPLLESTDPAVLEHEALYKRFTPSQKRWIVALVSFCGLIPCEYKFSLRIQSRADGFTAVFVSGSFIPSIPEIAKDLKSTGQVIR